MIVLPRGNTVGVLMVCVHVVLQEDCTPLHIACLCRCVDAALLLIKAEASLDLTDNVISIFTNYCCWYPLISHTFWNNAVDLVLQKYSLLP